MSQRWISCCGAVCSWTSTASCGQGVRASVESYSIKRLEPLYGFKREIDLRDAGESIVEFENWLEPEDGIEPG